METTRMDPGSESKKPNANRKFLIVVAVVFAVLVSLAALRVIKDNKDTKDEKTWNEYLQRGKEAREKGIPVTDNPALKEEALEYAAWELGWWEADLDFATTRGKEKKEELRRLEKELGDLERNPIFRQPLEPYVG